MSDFTPIQMRSEISLVGLQDFCDFINSKFSESPIESIVEIGSYTGESAVFFAKQFPNATIYCVDPWTPGYDDTDIASNSEFEVVEKMFDERTKGYNIVKIKADSLHIDIECDIVYIDGCHQYECVKDDIKYWKKRCSKAIAGHDYYPKEIADQHPHIKGVREAVDELFSDQQIHTFADGSWLVIPIN